MGVAQSKKLLVKVANYRHHYLIDYIVTVVSISFLIVLFNEAPPLNFGQVVV